MTLNILNNYLDHESMVDSFISQRLPAGQSSHDDSTQGKSFPSHVTHVHLTFGHVGLFVDCCFRIKKLFLKFFPTYLQIMMSFSKMKPIPLKNSMIHPNMLQLLPNKIFTFISQKQKQTELLDDLVSNEMHSVDVACSSSVHFWPIPPFATDFTT